MSVIEYLKRHSLISQINLDEAIACRDKEGGTIEDHLYRLRYFSEKELLQAIASAHSWSTVSLPGRRITENVLQMLPAGVAWEKRVLPFAEDPQTMSISVACENPDDRALSDYLREKFSGRPFKLYAAVGLILEAALVSHYGNHDITVEPVQIDESAILLKANLNLFTAALAARTGKSVAETVRVGPFVERLCRRLKLSSENEQVTISAAYLQDLAGLCFDDNSALDRQTALFKLQASAGDELVYPPTVLTIIRQMYPDLTTLTLSEATATDLQCGNILTIVDFYFKQFATTQNLSVSRYISIENSLRAQIGKFLLPDITTTFLEVLHDDVVYTRKKEAAAQILVLDEFNMISSELIERVNPESFECATATSANDFLLRFRQLRPDFLVIAVPGDSEKVRRLIEDLAAKGIPFPDIRAFVLHKADNSRLTAPLLKMGVYDVIRFAGNYDILLAKMDRVLAEREQESRHRLKVIQQLGTHGTLAHMNVIDLLQAMGPSDKTLHISVSAHGSNMSMYLSEGKLVYAECDGKIGADAIIKSLSWTSGIWSVDHIDVSELPEANIHRSIDSVLIEGCYLLDEVKRTQTTS